MLIGDPYKFSIISSTIKRWNVDSTFCNGILLFCINGNLFPSEIITTTLKCELPILKDQLNNLTIDYQLFNMQKEEAFSKIYSMTFPEDTAVSNDYRFNVSPQSFSDNGCFVFAVRNEANVRILAANLKYSMESYNYDLSKINVIESVFTLNELFELLFELNNSKPELG